MATGQKERDGHWSRKEWKAQEEPSIGGGKPQEQWKISSSWNKKLEHKGGVKIFTQRSIYTFLRDHINDQFSSVVCGQVWSIMREIPKIENMTVARAVLSNQSYVCVAQFRTVGIKLIRVSTPKCWWSNYSCQEKANMPGRNSVLCNISMSTPKWQFLPKL